MNRSLRLELAAVIGAPASGIALGIPYVFGLGSALLIGSAVHTPGVLQIATVFWVVGDLAAILGAAARIDRFAGSARHLRLPDHRVTQGRIYMLLCTFLVIVPLILFGTFVPGGRALRWTTLVLPLCLGWPALARWVRRRWPSRSGEPTHRRRHPIHAPADVIRVYLGSAFAPVAMVSRVSGWRLLGAAVWSVPVLLTETSVARPARWLVPYYLGLTAALVWAWLMTSLLKFISGRPAAFAELALLPGLGRSASQRRAFYGAALVRPMVVCACFSALALVWAGSTSHPWRHVALWGGVCLFLMFLGGCSILGLLLGRTARAATFIQVIQPGYIGWILLMNCVRFAEMIPVAFFSSLTILTVVLLAIIRRQGLRLARLPHPFLS